MKRYKVRYNIQNYSISGKPDKDGEWVKYQDFERLKNHHDQEMRQLSAQLAGVRKVAEDRGEEIAELKDLLKKVEYWKNEHK